MCSFESRRYSICQIVSDFSINKSNLLKTQSSHLLNLTLGLHPLPSFFVRFQDMNLSQVSASQSYHAVMERKM